MSDDRFVALGLAGAALTGIPVVDAHTHLGRFGAFPILDSSVEGLIRVMDRLGIAVAAASSTPGCYGGLIRLGNDQVIDAVQRYPERIFGYMSVNPRYPAEAEQELRRALAAGARGIKVHSLQGTPYNDPSYDLVWAFAQEHALPVLAHTWGKEIADLAPCFARYPAVSWILAHGGSADRERYVAAALAHPNVYVDTAYSPSPRGLIEYFMAAGLEDRLLWGSDMDFMAAAPQLGRVLFAKITPEQKAKVLGLNAVVALRLTNL